MNIKKIILEEINESIKLPIEIGDTVYMGRFKNKKVIVKDIKWNKKGDLMINGKSALRVRIPKKKSIKEGNMPKPIDEGISKYERVKKELEENGIGSMVCIGQSMFPIIKSGSDVTFIKQNNYEVGDIVFCVVNNYWVDAHIITKKDPQLGFMIADNHGSEDGWTNTIFGKAIQSNWRGQITSL